MKLDLLLNKVDVLDIIGDTNIEISNIQLDSRNISKGDMFIAITGTQKSGDEFIHSAIINGAKAIICHNTPSTYSKNVTYILVNDSNDVLSEISNNFLDASSSPVKPIKVTSIPKSDKFLATFAAPPGLSTEVSTSRIGTGASGEILLTCPIQYLSNMTSPITRIFFFKIILFQINESTIRYVYHIPLL